jgi:hypothetical protein
MIGNDFFKYSFFLHRHSGRIELDTMTFRIMTHSIMKHSIMTHSITTLSIKLLKLNDTQHNRLNFYTEIKTTPSIMTLCISCTLWWLSQLFIVTLSIVILNAVILNIAAPRFSLECKRQRKGLRILMLKGLKLKTKNIFNWFYWA